MNSSEEFLAPAKKVVIHVVTSLNFGGVERHMEVLGQTLDDAEFYHVIVAIGAGGAAASKLNNFGVKTICLNESTKIPSVNTLKALYRVFSIDKPMVVHAHGAEANFHALVAAFLARVPVRVGEEIGIPSHSQFAKFVFRYVYRTAHRVIGVSAAVVDWLLKSKEVTEKRVICLNNPVRLPVVRSGFRGNATSTFRICYVGRLEAVKNPMIILDSARQLIERGIPVEFWIVGDGSLRKEMESQAVSCGISDYFRFFGFQVDPFDYLRQCDLYIQPSLSEGFGLALIEAMGCGLPAVVTPVGIAPEIIEHGVTGWLMRDASAGALTDGLEHAWLSGENRLAEMGLNARAAVEGKFEPVHYLERLEGLYKQLAREQGIHN
jgi:glycosyltransferase involved in cell wall biosynthesis